MSMPTAEQKIILCLSYIIPEFYERLKKLETDLSQTKEELKETKEELEKTKTELEKLKFAYEESCFKGKLLNYKEALEQANEKRFIEEFKDKLSNATGIDAKLEVFLTLYPEEVRNDLCHVFHLASEKSGCPLNNLNFWRYDYGITWNHTYQAGYSMPIYTYERSRFEVNGKNFQVYIDPVRLAYINNKMDSFYSIFK